MSRFFADGLCFDPTYRPGTHDPHSWRFRKDTVEYLLEEIDDILALVEEYNTKRDAA